MHFVPGCNTTKVLWMTKEARVQAPVLTTTYQNCRQVYMNKNNYKNSNIYACILRCSSVSCLFHSPFLFARSIRRAACKGVSPFRSLFTKFPGSAPYFSSVIAKLNLFWSKLVAFKRWLIWMDEASYPFAQPELTVSGPPKRRYRLGHSSFSANWFISLVTSSIDTGHRIWDTPPKISKCIIKNNNKLMQ